MPQLSPTLKTLLNVVKVGAVGLILVVLYRRIQAADGFDRLLHDEKHWSYLMLAQCLVALAFCFSFIRWYLLVRGLDLEFRLRDALRLGSLGFMLNQFFPGSVGGDLLKAVFVAREQPEQKTEAVATVFIDRAIGLYAMLLIASVGVAYGGKQVESDKVFASLQTVVWTAAVVGTIGVIFALSALATGNHVRSVLGELPIVGNTLNRLIDAVEVYRSRRLYLLTAFCFALATHCLLISVFWLICSGLPVSQFSFLQNASIVPAGLVAGAIPSTPGGLGVLEGGMEYLYSMLGAAKGDGGIVALTYRAMTYLFAGIGGIYYFSARKKVDELIHEAEVLAEATD